MPRHNDPEIHFLVLSHYMFSAIVGAMSLFPLLLVPVGASVINTGLTHAPVSWAAVAFGAFLIVLGGGYCLVGELTAALAIVAARNLSEQRAWRFGKWVAGWLCCWAPLGTVIGVWSLIYLTRTRPAPLRSFDRGITS